MPPTSRYRSAPRVTSLGDAFYDVVEPASFPRKALRFRNDVAAARVGLDGLDDDEWTAAFATFSPLPENLEKPLALRYHGHQFDVYNRALGDGRGFLFAQVLDAEGRLLDLGTKGSGTTPWSRGGDGRLTLKGGVREVLATEMLGALGVPTSSSFSLIETGEELWRGDEPSPTRSSVLVRLSHSHVRFGTFQRLAYADDRAGLKRLFEYVTEHLVPAETPAALLTEVVRRSADLCAAWMVAGFVHGVLNSDNMNVTGEGFDYGPYRFLPVFDPGFIAAYFDHGGLYAFGRQPDAVLRNLERLARALVPISDVTALTKVLDGYEQAIRDAIRVRFLQRLSIESAGVDHDDVLIGAAYEFLAGTSLGYDRFFFDWRAGSASERRALGGPDREAYAGPTFTAFRRALDRHTPLAPEFLASSVFQADGPQSMLIDEIESIWSSIASADDWSPFERKIASVRAFGSALR